mmetsp:Transcript_20526/g.30410  ORF Transcript_20526/g.30410 Transcript_20526/m.30410 type:complete len:87 (-) Transcript_20526:1268-1528(-)
MIVSIPIVGRVLPASHKHRWLRETISLNTRSTGDSTFDYRMASSGETTEIRSKPSRQVRQVLRGDELPYDTKDTHHDANFEARNSS